MDNMAPPDGSRRRDLAMPTGDLGSLRGLGAQDAGAGVTEAVPALRVCRRPGADGHSGSLPGLVHPGGSRGLGAGGPGGRCQPRQPGHRYPAGHRQAAPLSRGGKARRAR